MSIKEKAINFLKMIVGGSIDEAFTIYVNPTGKHHNMHFKAGFEALKQAMLANHGMFPNKKLEVILALSDHNMVSLLTKVTIEDKEYSITHFFKFEEHKIFEMWDTAQEVPSAIINEDGAF